MKKIFLAAILLLALSACEHFGEPFIEPTIDVVNIEFLPTTGFEQAIRVDFRLTNHNPYDLPLKNLSYKLALDDRDLLSGSSSALTSIEANGSEVFSVDATVNLLRGALWLKSLLERDNNEVNYRLEAQITTGRFMAPTIKIQEQGSIPLSQ